MIAVDIGLQILHFHYLSLVGLLTAYFKQSWVQCIDLSRKMLVLLLSLDNAPSDVTNHYIGLIWQRLHCPLTAFGFLWGRLVVRSEADAEQREQYFKAIEHVPPFLSKSSSRNPVVAKL